MPGREWPQQADLTIPIFVRESVTKQKPKSISSHKLTSQQQQNTPSSFRGGVGNADIGKRRVVDYGTMAERMQIPQIWRAAAAAMCGPYLLLAQCYHEHLHAARSAELMLSEILHCPRSYGSRDCHRHCRHLVSELLHHSPGLSASSWGRVAKVLPFADKYHGQRSLGLRTQKAIEVAVCQQQEVREGLSQRGPSDI